MIIKIKIDEDSSLSFDTNDLPKGSDFDSLLHIIKENSLPSSSQFKIAYAYKNEYKYCKDILDHIKTTNIRDVRIKAEIFQMSLDMIHGYPLTITSEYSYNSYYILLGYENIKAKNYSRALVYFNKAQYKLGIELCNFYLKKNGNFTNEVLKALNIFNNKEVSNYKIGREMFKRNVDPEFYNGVFHNKNILDDSSSLNKNIDIQLRSISKDLSKIDEYNLDNEYFYYLKGKKEHLKRNYEDAVNFYKKSLALKYNVYAKYNLLRILQDECIDENYDCYEFNNFKYYMKYKKSRNADIKCDIENINKDIKDFININSGIKNNFESYITKYKTLLNNKLVDKKIINNNLTYYKYRNISYEDLEVDEEDIRILKDIYRENSSDYVKYNLLYLTRDITYYDPSNKYSTAIYNYLSNGSVEKCDIYDKLIKANSLKAFKECLTSFYGANGVGICLAKSMKYKESLKIFYSLALDYNEKCLKNNTRFKNNEYIKKIIRSVYRNIKNIDLLIKIYEKLGIIEIKEFIFRLLIDENRLDEAENYRVNSEYLNKIYKDKVEENKRIKDELKRRAKEIIEYKKHKKYE
ncbi:hypothetical protein P3W45_001824 [Vairimorpha bombi]